MRKGVLMIRSVLIALLLAICPFQMVGAQAMIYLHDGEPSFSITYPDGWDIRTPRAKGRNLMSAMPSDNTLLWQGGWIVRDAETIDQAVDRLSGMEGRLFQNVKRSGEPWSRNVGSVVLRCHDGNGTYQESQLIEFRICVFQLSRSRVGALAFMGDPAVINARRGDLETMMNSLEAWD